ncbi:MAG: metallophosphoesterase family protein [Promethearchaeota archaeon]
MFNIKSKSNKFVVYSDNRNVGIKKNKIHRKLLNFIQKQDKDFILHVGDIVFWGLAWKSFFRDLKHASIKVPFFPARGNHDDKYFFKKFFKLKQSYYSINYGVTHLIVLDDNKGILDEKQYNWLVNDLENHLDYKWIIVFAHKPLYSGAYRGVRKKLISQLEPLFKKYNVNLFIGSHYHNYERLQIDGITHIVSAGGGAPLTELKKDMPQLIKHETVYHYLLISIEISKLHAAVFDINNEKIDEFNINKIIKKISM